MAIQFSRDIDTTSTQVSRQFRHIVDEEPGMQYKIELHASGYADNEANTCTRTTERLNLYVFVKVDGSRLAIVIGNA